MCRFRSVDINDSGDISFSEFCVWLIHQLGPRLMQKISESVQSSAQASISSPEAFHGTNTSQTTQNGSPSYFQAQGKSPSLSPAPLRSAAVVNDAVGHEVSPTSSYFALQVILRLAIAVAPQAITVYIQLFVVLTCISQIGINYGGSAAPLAGCVSDIRGWAELFRSLGCSFSVHIVCRQYF